MDTIRINKLVSSILPEIRELRHELHQIPEIHPHEHQTRAKLEGALAGLPLNVWDPLVGTDLIAELKGNSERTIVLRADIDALPIEEKSGLPYASVNDGCMHACGHDGHAAMLVGAARVLAAFREHLPVSVRFVFQPGEEMAAGGEGLVAAGACDGAEAAFAIHGWPWIREGVLSAKPGPMFAAAGFFRLTFHGVGGHAAMPPNEVASPLVPAAHAIDLIEEFREQLYAQCGAIVTAASLQAGTASNVIPSAAVIEGTVRYFETETCDLVAKRLQDIATATATIKVKSVFEYHRQYWLPLCNSEKAIDYIRCIAEKYFPHGTWQLASKPTMGAEDFAFYLKDREGAMIWLGLGKDGPKLHTPEFDFNDNVLETGIRLLAMIALEYRCAK